MGRLFKSLTGLVVLLAVLAGVPYGLWVYGRSLLPDHVPSLNELKDALFTRDSGQTFISVLVIVGAIAWLLFVFCVLLEIIARAAGRERARRIRGLRPAQAGAAALIGLIIPLVMLGGAATASAQPVPAQHTVSAAHVFAVTTSTTGGLSTALSSAVPMTARQQPASPPVLGRSAAYAAPLSAPAGQPRSHLTWVVSRYDTLWSIAEKTLGHGPLWPKLVGLNTGIVQPDGKVLHDEKTPLEIGWRLILPAGATLPTDYIDQQPAPVVTHQVTVHDGDTLSEIAEHETGSADNYPAIAVANHLSNPDELAVGQILTIPGTAPVGQNPTAAAAEQKAEAEKAAQQKATQEKAEAENTAQEKAAQERAAAEQKAASQEKATPAPAAQPNAGHPHPTGQSSTPTTGSPTVQEPATSATARTTAQDPTHVAGWVELGAVGTAAAGALWLGLLAARRRQRHRRPSSKVKAPTSIPAAKLERRLRDRAGAAEVIWMDKALRLAAQLVTSRSPSELPDVTCVWLSAKELQIQLAAAVDAPEPFLAEDDSWILPADAVIPDESWTETQAPFPALASLGEADGESLLVDLERLGAVTVTGDPERTSALLRHLAVELAHNLWSDYLQVTLVGWGEHLRALNPDRLRHAGSVADIVAGVRGRLAETAEAERELDTTLLTSRLTGQLGDGDTWSPELYLIDADASTEQDLATLTELMSSRTRGARAAVAVIARHTESASAATTIHIDMAGNLTMPEVLGSMQIKAAGLSDQELDLAVELFTSAGQFTEPGPIQSDEPWADQMDVTGSLIAADPDADLADPVDHNQVEDVSDEVGQKVVQLRKPVSAAASAALQATLAGDPALDVDLAEWNDQLIPDPTSTRRESTPWVKRPRIGVLGTPLVMTNSSPPEDQQHRYTEFAVYFAVHREVQPSKFATDLWPEDNQPNPKLRTSYVSHTRAWLGINEEGRKHLSEARAGRGYRLTRLLDIEILRRLRKRADAKLAAGDPEGARTDLAAGLNLVRGPLLDGVPSDSYSWLTISDPEQLELAAATVVGVAHQLVMSALDIDDFDTARNAADVAFRFDPDDDQPKVDHVLIAHRAGDSAAKRGWALQILRDHEAEFIEDVENYDTMIALSQVFPKGLRMAEAG